MRRAAQSPAERRDARLQLAFPEKPGRSTTCPTIEVYCPRKGMAFALSLPKLSSKVPLMGEAMMSRRLIAGAVAALALSTSARAQDQTIYVVGGVNSESITILDLNSIKKLDRTIKIWVFDIQPPGKTKLLAGKPYNEIRVLMQFDCQDETARNGQTAFYDGDRFVYSLSDNSEWQPVVPETAGANMLKIVCGRERTEKLVILTSRDQVMAAYDRYLKEKR